MKLHSPERVAHYRALGYWDVATWAGALASNVESRPSAPALIDPPNRTAVIAGDPQRLTWAQVEANVDALAAQLYARGVRADAVVGIQLPNIVELPLALLAINRLGAIACPFPTAYREHELITLGGVAGLAAMVTGPSIVGRIPAAGSDDVRVGVPTLATVLVFGGELDFAAPSAVRSTDPAFREYAAGQVPDIDDCTTICWTSGTESVPKAVPRCAADWHSMARATIELCDDDTVMHAPYPIVNMAGISGFVSWLYTGCVSVLHHPFDLEVFLDQIERERITFTRAAPTVLTRLLMDDGPGRSRDLSSLKVVTSGSAALSGQMIATWKQRYGVDVCNFFGSNEGAALSSTPETVPDPEQRATLFPRLGVAGFSWGSVAAEGVRTRLVDPVLDVEITEPGRMGELRTSGPGVFSGYYHGGAAADPFDADGWLRTGDLFEISESDPRYYRYVDRLKDIVVRGGMNISSAELEGLVTAHPAVREAAVVGVPDAEYGETVCVFVVPVAGLAPTLGDIVDFLRGRKIASFKLPQRLELIDELPRSAAAKVLKRELRDRLTSDR